MAEVKIINADESLIQETAKVLLNVFQQEEINKYMYNFSDEKVKEAQHRAAVSKIRLYLKSGQRILLATQNNNVIGGLIFKRDVKISLGNKFKIYLPEIFGLLLSLRGINFKRTFSIANLFKLPLKITKPHYVLDAIGVMADYQGQGVGKLLLCKLHEIAEKDSNTSGIYLVTGEKKNQLIYEHLGYETVEIRQGKDITIYHMFRKNK